VKTIDLEAHFLTPTWQQALAANTEGYPRVGPRGLGFTEDAWMPLAATGVDVKLADMAEKRIAYMDEAGVDYAVLSLTSPGAEQFPIEVGKTVAKDANDLLAAAMKKYPDRFGGFASLAPKDPEWAATELERCVKELGFKGWNTHSNYGDSYLDEKKYWPILAMAEKLDVPIYLHPAVSMIKELNEFGIVLGGPTMGFGIDVTYCFMRMIVRGVFDEHPNLKIIMGHLGEALPFLVDRVNRAWMQKHETPNAQIGPGPKERAGHYLRKNLWVTTSGNYLPAALVCTRDAIGMDKILLGTDFPYENMTDCMDYLRSLPLTEEEAYALFEGNAEALGF
jgi:predicted TIM-barrel fold metal-dependent hydrolase